MNGRESEIELALRLAAHQQLLAMTLAFALRDWPDAQAEVEKLRDATIQQWSEATSKATPTGVSQELMTAAFDREVDVVMKMAGGLLQAFEKP